MHVHNVRVSVLLTLIIGLFSLPMSAGEQSAADGKLEVKTHNGIAYIAGGVGKDERMKIDELAADFSLQLTFADSSGKYLSGVNVKVENSAGEEILKTKARGPLFRADLAPGTYSVDAEPEDFSGEKQTREVTVTDSPTAINLMW